MESSPAAGWGAWVLRGVAAILFGVVAFALPGLTLASLVYLFGGYVVLDGLLALVAMIGHRGGRRPWWSLLIEGVTGLAFGVMAFAFPGLTLAALLYLVAGWSFATGVFEIAAALRMRREVTGEWALALAGVLSVAFAALLVALPAAGLLAVAWMIGVYAVVFGLSLLALGLRLRAGLRPDAPRSRQPPPSRRSLATAP